MPNLVKDNIRALTFAETQERLRRVTLRGHPEVRIYQHADIVLHQVHVHDLYYAQQYVLKPTLIKVEQKLKDLDALELNGLDLQGAVLTTDTNTGRETTFMPPIVEQCTENADINLVADGMHRCYCAFKKQTMITVLLIQNIPPQYPYYAFPSDRDWNALTRYEEAPPRALRKRYREPDNYKRLFRLYNDVFPNVQPKR